MTLDTRAHRAAQGIHRAVEVMEMSTSTKDPRKIERFDRFRDRKQRSRRIGAIVVVAAVVILAVVLVTTNALDRGYGDVPVSPAGDQGVIVFAVWGAQQRAALYSVDAAGGPVRDLHVNTDPSAAWFPDGSRILVTSGAGPAATREPLRPATVAPDGTDFTLLGATTNPELNLGCGAISPDGSRLACMGFGAEGVDGLYTVRASDGGGAQRLTDVAVVPADYSPDGNKIVFFRVSPSAVPPGSSGTLFVISTDGKGTRRITPRGFVEGEGASWSPDGVWIAFSHFAGADRGRRIYLVHPDGTGLHPLEIDPSAGLRSEWDPAWSPDGTRIAFDALPRDREGDPDIYLADADGSDVEHLSNPPDVGGEASGLDWGSPSG